MWRNNFNFLKHKRYFIYLQKRNFFNLRFYIFFIALQNKRSHIFFFLRQKLRVPCYPSQREEKRPLPLPPTGDRGGTGLLLFFFEKNLLRFGFSSSFARGEAREASGGRSLIDPPKLRKEKTAKCALFPIKKIKQKTKNKKKLKKQWKLIIFKRGVFPKMLLRVFQSFLSSRPLTGLEKESFSFFSLLGGKKKKKQNKERKKLTPTFAPWLCSASQASSPSGEQGWYPAFATFPRRAQQQKEKGCFAAFSLFPRLLPGLVAMQNRKKNRCFFSLRNDYRLGGLALQEKIARQRKKQSFFFRVIPSIAKQTGCFFGQESLLRLPQKPNILCKALQRMYPRAADTRAHKPNSQRDFFPCFARNRLYPRAKNPGAKSRTANEVSSLALLLSPSFASRASQRKERRAELPSPWTKSRGKEALQGKGKVSTPEPKAPGLQSSETAVATFLGACPPKGGHSPAALQAPLRLLRKQKGVKKENFFPYGEKTETSYTKLTEIQLISIGLASPDCIRRWAEKTLPNGKVIGKVTNANTLHHKTFKPQKGGLFCERIFGPLKDFECACGKTKKNNFQEHSNWPMALFRNSTEINEKKISGENKTFSGGDSQRKYCPICDVEYTWSIMRRYQLGYIDLVSPVIHVWYLKATPSYLSILLDIKKKHLEHIIYCSEAMTLEKSIRFFSFFSLVSLPNLSGSVIFSNKINNKNPFPFRGTPGKNNEKKFKMIMQSISKTKIIIQNKKKKHLFAFLLRTMKGVTPHATGPFLFFFSGCVASPPPCFVRLLKKKKIVVVFGEEQVIPRVGEKAKQKEKHRKKRIFSLLFPFLKKGTKEKKFLFFKEKKFLTFFKQSPKKKQPPSFRRIPLGSSCEASSFNKIFSLASFLASQGKEKGTDYTPVPMGTGPTEYREENKVLFFPVSSKDKGTQKFEEIIWLTALEKKRIGWIAKLSLILKKKPSLLLKDIPTFSFAFWPWLFFEKKKNFSCSLLFLLAKQGPLTGFAPQEEKTATFFSVPFKRTRKKQQSKSSSLPLLLRKQIQREGRFAFLFFTLYAQQEGNLLRPGGVFFLFFPCPLNGGRRKNGSFFSYLAKQLDPLKIQLLRKTGKKLQSKKKSYLAKLPSPGQSSGGRKLYAFSPSLAKHATQRKKREAKQRGGVVPSEGRKKKARRDRYYGLAKQLRGTRKKYVLWVKGRTQKPFFRALPQGAKAVSEGRQKVKQKSIQFYIISKIAVSLQKKTFFKASQKTWKNLIKIAYKKAFQKVSHFLLPRLVLSLFLFHHWKKQSLQNFAKTVQLLAPGPLARGYSPSLYFSKKNKKQGKNFCCQFGFWPQGLRPQGYRFDKALMKRFGYWGCEASPFVAKQQRDTSRPKGLALQSVCFATKGTPQAQEDFSKKQDQHSCFAKRGAKKKNSLFFFSLLLRKPYGLRKHKRVASFLFPRRGKRLPFFFKKKKAQAEQRSLAKLSCTPPPEGWGAGVASHGKKKKNLTKKLIGLNELISLSKITFKTHLYIYNLINLSHYHDFVLAPFSFSFFQKWKKNLISYVVSLSLKKKQKRDRKKRNKMFFNIFCLSGSRNLLFRSLFSIFLFNDITKKNQNKKGQKEAIKNKKNGSCLFPKGKSSQKEEAAQAPPPPHFSPPKGWGAKVGGDFFLRQSQKIKVAEQKKKISFKYNYSQTRLDFLINFKVLPIGCPWLVGDSNITLASIFTIEKYTIEMLKGTDKIIKFLKKSLIKSVLLRKEDLALQHLLRNPKKKAASQAPTPFHPKVEGADVALRTWSLFLTKQQGSLLGFRALFGAPLKAKQPTKLCPLLRKGQTVPPSRKPRGQKLKIFCSQIPPKEVASQDEKALQKMYPRVADPEAQKPNSQQNFFPCVARVAEQGLYSRLALQEGTYEGQPLKKKKKILYAPNFFRNYSFVMNKISPVFFDSSLIKNRMNKIIYSPLINNIYSLSHRYRWEHDVDWTDFLEFISSPIHLTDKIIPKYEYRFNELNLQHNQNNVNFTNLKNQRNTLYKFSLLLQIIFDTIFIQSNPTSFSLEKKGKPRNKSYDKTENFGTIQIFTYKGIKNFSFFSSLLAFLPSLFASQDFPVPVREGKKQIEFEKSLNKNLREYKKNPASLIAFSGGGLIQKLLNEYTPIINTPLINSNKTESSLLFFSHVKQQKNELNKMDKQNRILLYELNKQIFFLKQASTIFSLNILKKNVLAEQSFFSYGKKAPAELLSLAKLSSTPPPEGWGEKTNKNRALYTKRRIKSLIKQRDLLTRRTKLVRKFFISSKTEQSPSLMILSLLPVLPPDLRPIVKMGNSAANVKIAASDLNRLYQRVIYRNERLRKLLVTGAASLPFFISSVSKSSFNLKKKENFFSQYPPQEDPGLQSSSGDQKVKKEKVTGTNSSLSYSQKGLLSFSFPSVRSKKEMGRKANSLPLRERKGKAEQSSTLPTVTSSLASQGKTKINEKGTEIKFTQGLLQEAVDNLIQNNKSGVLAEKDSHGRTLKSLSDILKGKQGRFRQYLLGKRVDYSGRSVIIVGPKLKLHECGIPKEMALELFLPFLLKKIINYTLARTVVGAKSLIKKNKPLIWELLIEIMQVCPVLLNRAPTLHRLGIQAFIPKLIDGRAILLHPLVCSAFNADFDGDQMAVHVPITVESRAEAWKLMLSSNNLLSSATGDPISVPSQDMILGCYYLTTQCDKSTTKKKRGFGLYFKNKEDVLKAYNLQKIDLHAAVWLQWNAFIEDGNEIEYPLEIRINQYGIWKEISAKSHRNFDYHCNKINTYIKTTPGRLRFNEIINNSIVYGEKKEL